jgi:hypothetical protein
MAKRKPPWSVRSSLVPVELIERQIYLIRGLGMRPVAHVDGQAAEERESSYDIDSLNAGGSIGGR